MKTETESLQKNWKPSGGCISLLGLICYWCDSCMVCNLRVSAYDGQRVCRAKGYSFAFYIP